MNQFNLTSTLDNQIWYLDMTDQSEYVSRGWTSATNLCWHRTDGPAVIYADGSQSWWVNDARYYNNKSFQEAAKLTDEEMMIVILKYGNVS